MFDLAIKNAAVLATCMYVFTHIAARIYQRVLEIECGDVILQCIYTRGGRD